MRHAPVHRVLVHYSVWIGTLLLTVAGRPALAQEDATPPVPLADLKDKPGGHHATLTVRSPLSVDLKLVAKRLGLRVAPTAPTPATPPPAPHASGGPGGRGMRRARPSSIAPAAGVPAAASQQPPADVTDYDLAKESFYVYVPAAPDADGKYGVMVGQNFKEHDAPPKAWTAVLDAHHLIWIDAKDAGDDKAPCHRVGLLLDAAHNVAKVWPVDPDRVYLSMMTFVGPTAGTAMDYPDVFAGEIQSIAMPWYAKIKVPGKPPQTLDTDNFPQPASKDLSLAKSHSRFYLAPRVESATDANWDVVLKRGYKSASFKYVKADPIKADEMAEYTDLHADWFERGVAFLDAPLAELKAKAKPQVGKPLAKNPISPNTR